MRPPHSRRVEIPFHWPAHPFELVLVEPEIPGNTGNIARLAAATGSRLHLVGPLGFQLTDRRMRRAGLDYWPSVDLHRHADWPAFLRDAAPARRWLLSTRGARGYTTADFRPGDALVFGSESRGLPDALLDAHPGAVLGIPMRLDAVRSLNLADAVALVLYEALRQTDVRARASADEELSVPVAGDGGKGNGS